MAAVTDGDVSERGSTESESGVEEEDLDSVFGSIHSDSAEAGVHTPPHEFADCDDEEQQNKWLSSQMQVSAEIHASHACADASADAEISIESQLEQDRMQEDFFGPAASRLARRNFEAFAAEGSA